MTLDPSVWGRNAGAGLRCQYHLIPWDTAWIAQGRSQGLGQGQCFLWLLHYPSRHPPRSAPPWKCAAQPVQAMRGTSPLPSESQDRVEERLIHTGFKKPHMKEVKPFLNGNFCVSNLGRRSKLQEKRKIKKYLSTHAPPINWAHDTCQERS